MKHFLYRFVLGCALAPWVHADKTDEGEPVWELGLFTGVATFPEYPGSDHYDQYYLPVPFGTYRGEKVEVKERGLDGYFYRSDRLEVKLSFSGHPPVNSNSDAREGMEELDPLLEGGISMDAYFKNTPEQSFRFHVAARQALSLGFEDNNFDGQGQRGTVQFIFRDREIFGSRKWGVGTRVGIFLVSDDYADYFYTVRPGEATDERPAYQSDGGYGGFMISQSLTYEVNPRLKLASFIRWHNLDGVSFSSSPLFREENNFYGGGAVIWTFAQSKKRVHR